MKLRLTALALAALLLLGLTACGSRQLPISAHGTPEPSSLPSAQTIEATATPEATEPAETQTPEVLAEPSGQPEGSPAPSQSPAVDGPSQWPIVGEPFAPPSDEPAKTPTAAEVYAAVSAAAGVSYDNATSYIDAYYTSLDLNALSDYVFYMPDMSAQIEEIVIAKVSGDMDAVKSTCRDRQAAMAEEAAFYGTTGAYVDSYQLVTEGDWLLFCVCEKSADAVSAFRSSVK